MILATVDTGSYKFVVVSENQIDAKIALADAFRKHVEQTDADPAFMQEALDEWTNYKIIEPNQVLRDGAPL